MEKFLCPSDRSGPISQDGLATFVRSPNDPQFISCAILAFAFFCFFFIFILPFSAIFQMMASQQPNLKFFLLRHLGFCTFLTFVYLNIFSPYCVIFQKMAWQRKSPMIYNLSLSANFSSPNQFCFLRIVFLKIICIFKSGF